MQDRQSSRKKPPIHQYAVYSNLAFEMGAVIVLGVFGGIKLDNWLGVSPLFTIVCSLAAIGLSLYLAVRSVSKQK